MLRKQSLNIVAGVMLLVCPGCGNDDVILAPVSGSVSYKGKPVSKAMVTFSRVGVPRIGTGITDDGGSFVLTTVNTNDGAPVGDCAVTISKLPEAATGGASKEIKPEDYQNLMAEKMKGGKTSSAAFKSSGKTDALLPIATSSIDSALPTKYSDAHSSGLRRTVVGGGSKNIFKFELAD